MPFYFLCTLKKLNRNENMLWVCLRFYIVLLKLTLFHKHVHSYSKLLVGRYPCYSRVTLLDTIQIVTQDTFLYKKGTFASVKCSQFAVTAYHSNSCHFIKGRSRNPGRNCPQLFPGEMNWISHWGPWAPAHIYFSSPDLEGLSSKDHSAQCCFVSWESPMVDFLKIAFTQRNG